MTVVIHHNPDCGTSRNVLEIIRASGEEPTVIEYLKTGWTEPQLFVDADGKLPSIRTKRTANVCSPPSEAIATSEPIPIPCLRGDN
jgi:arsenate reductase